MLRRLKTGEYTILQAFNYNVSIYKEGRLVFHAIRHEKCNDDELLKILEAYKEFQEDTE